MGIAIYNFADNNYLYNGNRQPKKLVNNKTIFQCASLSKQVIAYITLKMIIIKVMQLDKSIYYYLTKDELNMFNINDKLDVRYKHITIRMLLSHTSGLPNGGSSPTLQFTPGTLYGYSGMGYNLLQKIIEKINKKPLNEIYKNIFKYKHSSFIYEKKFETNLAFPYEKNKTSKNFRYDDLLPYGAWSLYSNLEDYVNFIKKVISNKEVLKLMMTEQIKINNKISVGLGVLLCDNIIWQWGDNYRYKNFMQYDPVNNVGFISLSNSTNGWSSVKDLINKNICDFLIKNYKDKTIFDK